MKSREPKYATFDQAKWLKEKDFDVEVQWAFDQNGEDYKDEHWDINYNSPSYNCYSKPEQHQVVEWLLKKHGVWVQVTIDVTNFGIKNTINQKFKAEVISQNRNVKFKSLISRVISKDGILAPYDSPQEAYSAAFDYINKEGLI